MEDPIENKVAKSGLITLDLEQMKPAMEVRSFDMAECLWEGLVLKEETFRAFVLAHDWHQYKDAFVHIHCSTEAIIPTWAYMLIATKLQGISTYSIVGSKAELEHMLWLDWVRNLDLSAYTDQRVILKGCGDESIPESVYLALSARLSSVVKSLMYGEPCSTVPIYKKK